MEGASDPVAQADNPTPPKRHALNLPEGWLVACAADRWHAMSRGSRLIVIAAVAGLYFGAAKLGFQFAFATRQVTAVWPPTALAAVVYLLFGWRVWPGVFLGAFWVNALSSEPAWTAAGIAVGNTGAGLVGIGLMRRFVDFDPRLEHVRSVLGWTLFVAAAGCVVSASNGVVQLALGGIIPWSAMGSVWWVWWIGDTMGVMLFGPLLLTLIWSSELRQSLWRWGRMIALYAALAGLCTLVFAQQTIETGTSFRPEYALFPLVIGIALRYSQREVAVAIVLICGFAIWGTVHDRGPFTLGTLDHRLILLELFMAVTSLTGLTLGAVTAERRLAERQLRAAHDDLDVRVRALRDSEKRFRATFEQAAVGIAHVAPDGRWLRVNQKLCDIVGYSREELLSLTVQDITHPDDLDADLALVHQVLDGEIDTYTMEKRYLRKDGSELWIALTVALVKDEAGKADYFISVVEDIQRRKQAEEAVQRLNADLERRVDERTAEFQAANQELDSFSYAVCHDLRAPLRAMGGFSQVLLEDYGGRLEGDAHTFLEQIIKASRTMGALIDGLLQLSRSTRGELRRDHVDLSALAETIRAELVRQEPARAVEWHIEPGLWAWGDARMLMAVMRNLLENAWKYSSCNERAIVRVHRELRHGAPWFCVSDNGAGFDMAHADRLFKPFQRLHRQEEFPGIGIGLSTVQRIIHRHGGEIRAASQAGACTTVAFTLPGAPGGDQEGPCV